MAWSAIEVRGQVLANCAWRDPQAQLQPQFISDAPLSPREVFMRYLLDERLQLDRNRGPARARWAMPPQVPPLAPPPLKGLWLYNSES
jgi:hypothetical protein